MSLKLKLHLKIIRILFFFIILEVIKKDIILMI